MQDKLRVRVRDLRERKISVLHMFEESDIAGHTDYVNRMEFKGILKRMGFSLIDEPEPVSVSSSSAMRRIEEERHDSDINAALNDTMGSDDVLMHYGTPFVNLPTPTRVYLTRAPIRLLFFLSFRAIHDFFLPSDINLFISYVHHFSLRRSWIE